MASRYWVGGTATWDATAGAKWAATSGGAGGSAVPTAADDVFLDASSGAGTVTLSSSSVCRSLNCTGFTGTLSHPAATTLSIGDATAGAGNVVLALSAGMTYTLGDPATSALTLASTSSTKQTLAFGGKTIGNITFGGAGGNWALTSALAQGATAALTHTAGTLQYDGTSDNAGLSHTVGVITCTGSTTRSAVFGTSTVTAIRSTAATHFSISGTNLTFSGASATFVGSPSSTGRITYTYTFPTGAVLGSLILNGQGERTLGTYTVGTLTRNGTANYWDQVNPQNGGTLTVTGAFNLISAGADYRMTVWPSSTANPCTIVLAGATRNFQYVDWQDCIFDNGGANLDLSGDVGGSGDCGGNVLINGGALTFTASATQTWQGTAGGNWNDVAKWSSRVPLPQDDVIIGALSGSPTITINRKWACRSLDASQGTGAFTLAMGSVYETYFTGDWTGRSGMALSNASGAYRCSVRSNRTWTANGMSTPGMSMLVDTSQSTAVTFANGWAIGGSVSLRAGVINIPSGATVSFDSFVALANLVQQPSIVNVAGIWQLRLGSGTLFTASTTPAYTKINDQGGHIRLTSTAAGTKTFATSGLSFPDVRVVPASAGTFAFTGGGSFPRLPRPYSAGTATITLASGTTTTITSPSRDTLENGTNVVTLKSATGGSAATISKAGGQLAADYLSLQDITFTGGAPMFAGANSTNVSGNTGITFAAAPDWCPQALIAA